MSLALLLHSPRRLRFNPTEGFALALVVPALAMEAMFVFAPLVVGFWFSLHDVRYFNVGRFVGWDNYLAVLNSQLVVNSMIVTATFAALSLVITFSIGLSLALYLERDSRSAVLMRTIVLVPYVVSMLVGSLLLKWLLSQDSGVTQALLLPFGVSDFSILSDPKSAMGALVFNAIWRDSAFAMILLLAGLKSIPRELHLAARVDGASAWYRFKRLTLPMLKLPILITLIRLLMHFANSLTYPLILTAGGPMATTETTTLRIFRLGFSDYMLGRANALTFLTFILNVVLLIALVRVFQKNGKL
ncbi:carbohydrate ABC transporter permease [Microvirga antarctica]|uniref:carbohydrate ABC transporter permease n=1 Tax=Microvirga antarctica TaxID=2819233 RepID=UPI001B311C47|nr:sugar ABC transporter permease [Microvirga antarctica]